MRLESTLKNSAAGLIYLFTYTLLGFVSRTAFVRILGMEYNGLNALYSSVLSIFSMAELGIGVAISYCLYKPLAEGDAVQVSGLMNYYRLFYRLVAAVVMGASVLAMPFLRYFVTTTLPMDYVRIVFILFAFDNALSYLFTYKTTLLIADQKNYIYTLYETLINTAILILRLTVLIFTKNYLAYILTGILVRLAGNILRTAHIDRMYPYLKEQKSIRLNKDERKAINVKVGDMAAYKICDVAVGATDNVLLSVLCGGVITVGLYANYVLIINVANGLAAQFVNSYQASLGNLYAEEGTERVYDIYKKASFLSEWIATFFGCCLIGLLQPFMTLWMGENALLSNAAVLACSLAFSFRIMEDPLGKVINAAGLFAKDKHYALFQAMVNLISSVALGIHFGVAGVFMGTILGTITVSLLRSRYIFVCFFQKKYRIYLLGFCRRLLLLSADVLLTLGLMALLDGKIGGGIGAFLVKMLCCLIFPNALNWLLLHKKEEYAFYLCVIKDLLCRLKRKNARH